MEIYHFGIKGQKWGVRRYQNADGTLTDAGRKRYGTEENYNNAKAYARAKRNMKIARTANLAAIPAAVMPGGLPLLVGANVAYRSSYKRYKEARDKYADTMLRDKKKNLYTEEIKKTIRRRAIAAGTVAAIGLSIYGAKKVSSLVEHGNAEWLKQGRDNAEWIVSAIGDRPIKASFIEKAGNAAKYYSGRSNRKPFALT